MNAIRRILLIAAVLLAVIPAAEAQLRYGIRLGGVISDASLKDAGDYSLTNKGSFSGGFVLEYQVPTCGFAADVALLYTRYNVRLQHDGAREGNFSRNFVEIPVHAKYKFWMPAFHNLFAPLVYTGPSLMIRAGNSHGNPMATDVLQPGWDVGIGFDIVNFIQVQGGYRFGLGNAAKSFAAHPDARYRTNGWQVNATILFDF